MRSGVMSKMLSMIARCRIGAVARKALRGVLPAAMIWAGMYPVAALAVPSYSRQTHQACDACHVGSFGPQLTPFGRGGSEERRVGKECERTCRSRWSSFPSDKK